MAEPHLIESVASATAHRDRDELDAAIARLLLDFLEAERVRVLRLVDDGGVASVQVGVAIDRDGRTEAAAGRRNPSKLMRLDFDPAWSECVATRDPVHAIDAEGRWRSVFAVLGERDVLGLLEIEVEVALAPRDTRLVEGILRIMRNHLALLEYGERDTLTGLLNRKTFDLHFGKLLQRTRRTGSGRAGGPSWVALVDVDEFKSINDRAGHLFGDEVLLLIAQQMRGCFRGEDKLYRFGGEEFVVVLEAASAAGAAVALERLRAAVENYRFPQIGHATVSVGYTQVEGGDTPASAFDRADAALYFVKQNGRNRVASFEALEKDGKLARKSGRSDIELF
jgi:diguanylate cyclase (GGDEF)-like protein